MQVKTRHTLERALWLIALISVSYTLFLGFRAEVYRQTAQPGTGVVAAQDSFPELTHIPGSSTVSDRATSSVMGRLDIPSLSLSVAVLPDFGPASLLKGVGHIQGTALPGGLGTVGLAGHRDTFFRPLRRASTGMEIQLSDQISTYRYRIDSMEVVAPDRVDVLEITSRPELVLITCYPFDFIGAAPQRFIVHAHLISVAPESAEAKRLR